MSGQKIISITCWVRILCYWSLALKAEALANGCFEGASTSVRISGDAKIVLRCAIWLKSRGRMAPPKRMNFRKSSKGGGDGVISNPKIYIADFGPLVFPRIHIDCSIIRRKILGGKTLVDQMAGWPMKNLLRRVEFVWFGGEVSRFKRFVAKLVRVKKKEEEEVKRNLLSAGTSSTYMCHWEILE